MEDQAENGGGPLTDDRGDGGPRDAHFRTAQITEDQNRVQDQVDQGAGHLRRHAGYRPPRGLQHSLKEGPQEDARGIDLADAEIGDAVSADHRIIGEHGDKGPASEKSPKDEDQGAGQGKEQTCRGSFPCLLKVFLPQLSGNQSVGSHASAYRYSDLQHLGGIGQRGGRQRCLVDPGDKDAVDDIVHGLDHHGNHDGDGHGKDQLGNGHGAHLVFSVFFFRCLRLHALNSCSVSVIISGIRGFLESVIISGIRGFSKSVSISGIRGFLRRCFSIRATATKKRETVEGQRSSVVSRKYAGCFVGIHF